MTNYQISFINKKYRSPDDVRDTRSFTAIHATISKKGEEETIFASRTVSYQDFIENVLDKVFGDNLRNKSVEITEKGFKIDSAFMQYLKDKYQTIEFK
ncbi:hypothetical protein ACA30_15750 [Virgibacillus soli]|nr:hypothetical protein ACA30_15750 [Virgibacillus soli]